RCRDGQRRGFDRRHIRRRTDRVQGTGRRRADRAQPRRESMARVMLWAIGLALALWLATTTPAAAEPISLAVGLTALIEGIGVSTAVASAIGGAIVSTAIGVGLSVVAGMFTAPKDQGTTAAEEKGAQLGISIGGDTPRSAIYGTQATAGHFVYFNTFDQ